MPTEIYILLAFAACPFVLAGIVISLGEICFQLQVRSLLKQMSPNDLWKFKFNRGVTGWRKLFWKEGYVYGARARKNRVCLWVQYLMQPPDIPLACGGVKKSLRWYRFSSESARGFRVGAKQ